MVQPPARAARGRGRSRELGRPHGAARAPRAPVGGPTHDAHKKGSCSISCLQAATASCSISCLYTCCGGYMPCSGRCGESHCPELCLCTEVFLCFANSVASTRFMLQDEFNLQTTKCDNCIIGFMFCLQQVACIFSCIACITGSNELQEASRVL
uniref:Uncharacterized protein n=1 Tax=Nicotiana tabacum TaxID=4097 RepID=A0A1S4D7T3_TOBAC|nr:PREDICTED: uncharacterized protein LOC107826891 [Nicotiana tabacum]